MKNSQALINVNNVTGPTKYQPLDYYLHSNQQHYFHPTFGNIQCRSIRAATNHLLL